MNHPDTPPAKPKIERYFSLDHLPKWPADKLSARDVLTGLLDHGLFAEKVPPCFTSKGLALHAESSLGGIFDEADEKKLAKKINGKSHDYIRYEALRDINIPRHLGIPHPESYSVQALAIKKHWDEIKAHCGKLTPPVSRVYVRHVGGGCIFEMNYKGGERYQLEEDEINWMAGAQFVVKADIAACFPSIYTHSIPWALHERETSKQNPGIKKLPGNLLDKCTQITRDKQTNGLLIGPHASNIVSEIILTDVDYTLQARGYTKLKRHIDDYVYYADTYDEAEKFLNQLGLELRAYEMSLNEKKTRILPLPRPTEENWKQELNRFVFPKGDVIFSTVRSFLDLALENALAAGTSAPLNYAIQVLADTRGERPLNLRAKRLYIQEAINLALSYPYLAPLLDKFVFDKHTHETAPAKIAEFSTALVRLGTRKLYPDTIAHAFYYALKHDLTLPIKEDELLEVLAVDDCIANVLLLEYAVKQSLKEVQTAVRERAAKLKSGDSRDRDKHWLLIYQTWTEKELEEYDQNFLSTLKKQDFRFLAVPARETVNPAVKGSEFPDSIYPS